MTDLKILSKLERTGIPNSGGRIAAQVPKPGQVAAEVAGCGSVCKSWAESWLLLVELEHCQILSIRFCDLTRLPGSCSSCEDELIYFKLGWIGPGIGVGSVHAAVDKPNRPELGGSSAKATIRPMLKHIPVQLPSVPGCRLDGVSTSTTRHRSWDSCLAASTWRSHHRPSGSWREVAIWSIAPDRHCMRFVTFLHTSGEA